MTSKVEKLGFALGKAVKMTVDAAKDAGVEYVVKISAIGAGPDEPSMSLRYHWQGEQDLERVGVPYTHTRSLPV